MNRRRMLMMLAAPVWAQSNEEKGRKTVDAAVKALGGERFLAMKDRTETGRVYSFYNSRLSGLSRATIRTRYLTRPEPPDPAGLYVRERQSFGKNEDYHILFDEKDGWSITYRGAAPLLPDNVTRYQETTRRNVFYLLKQRIGEKGLILEHRGVETSDNQPVETVEFTDAANNVVSVSFHMTTHLPVKQIYFRRDPINKEKQEEVTLFSKYRDVSGVQWPYSIQRYRNGEKIYEIFSETVAIDLDLPDQFFTIPANMKVLPPLK